MGAALGAAAATDAATTGAGDTTAACATVGRGSAARRLMRPRSDSSFVIWSSTLTEFAPKKGSRSGAQARQRVAPRDAIREPLPYPTGGRTADDDEPRLAVRMIDGNHGGVSGEGSLQRPLEYRGEEWVPFFAEGRAGNREDEG